MQKRSITKKHLSNIIKLIFLVLLFFTFQLYGQKFKIHKVKEGETINDIAKQYNVSYSDILEYNGKLSYNKKLKEGQTLIIPTEQIKKISPDSLKISGNIIDYKYHTVGKNETVFKLSKNYNSKIEGIIRLNKIEGNNIKLGQILIIPIYGDPKAIKQTNKEKYTYYIVKPKQGKWRIAYDHGITVDELERLNPEIKNNNLQIGQKLLIPKFRTVETMEIRNEKKYIYHNVKPKETLFGLAKKYHTTIDEIRKLNPNLKNGLKEGISLKFLRNETNKKQTKNNKYIYHEVKPKETMFSLTKKYKTTIDKLLEWNPELSKGLKTGNIIRLLKKEINNSEAEDLNAYMYHEVLAKETLFSISKKFNIPIEKIIELNPKVKDGLKTGEILKLIFTTTQKNKEFYTVNDSLNKQIKINLLDSINKEKEYKLAILLPFKFNKTDTLSKDNFCKYINKSKIIDYYSGIKLAIDSLKTYGMKISYDVFDTQGSTFVVKRILETNDLSDYDFVIGPIKKENIDLLATRLSMYNTPNVVHKYNGNKVFRNLVITGADDKYLKEHIIHYLSENSSENNISVIFEDNQKETVNELVNKLNIVPKLIKGKKTKHGYSIKIDEIAKKLSKGKSNYVVLISEDDSFIFTVLSSLNSLSGRYNIVLFTLKDLKLYEDDSNDRTNVFLANLDYHFPSKMIRLIDPILKKSFKNHYHFTPRFAGINGFDSTFDLLLRAGNSDNLFEGLQKIGKTKQSSKVFLYKFNPEIGFKNQGNMILRLNKNLMLEVVE